MENKCSYCNKSAVMCHAWENPKQCYPNFSVYLDTFRKMDTVHKKICKGRQLLQSGSCLLTFWNLSNTWATFKEGSKFFPLRVAPMRKEANIFMSDLFSWRLTISLDSLLYVSFNSNRGTSNEYSQLMILRKMTKIFIFVLNGLSRSLA